MVKDQFLAFSIETKVDGYAKKKKMFSKMIVQLKF